MKEYFPYIATILCSIFSGFASYLASRRQAKADLQKIQKQYELEIEMEREKFHHEKEKMELEHKHQLELMQKETENKLGTELVSTITKEYMNTPEAKEAMRQSVSKSKNNGRKRR